MKAPVREKIVKTFWLALPDNIENRMELKKGIETKLSRSPFVESSLYVELKKGLFARRGLKSVMRQKFEKENTLVACLRLPLNIVDGPLVTPSLKHISPTVDPLLNLMSFHNFVKKVGIAKAYSNYVGADSDFEKYYIAVISSIGVEIDTPLFKKINPYILKMFLASLRSVMASQKDWEALIRNELGEISKDTSWNIIDSYTQKFVKPLPDYLFCSPVTDQRTLDHYVKQVNDTITFSNHRIIEMEPHVTIAPNLSQDIPLTDKKAHIDFIFTVEAGWRDNTVEVYNPKNFHYQLGIHFGSPHLDFFKCWMEDYGTAENITFTNHRSEFSLI